MKANANMREVLQKKAILIVSMLLVIINCSIVITVLVQLAFHP